MSGTEYGSKNELKLISDSDSLKSIILIFVFKILCAKKQHVDERIL